METGKGDETQRLRHGGRERETHRETQIGKQWAISIQLDGYRINRDMSG